MTSTDDLITATEAGSILGCSARTISRRAERGELAYEQKLSGPRGAYLFSRARVEAIAATVAA